MPSERVPSPAGAAVGSGSGPGDLVGLTLPAQPEMYYLVRLVASAMASRAGFDIDEVADFVLAIEELCLSVAGERRGEGELHLRFELTGDTVTTTAWLVPGKHSVASSSSGTDAALSGRLLDALVDGRGSAIEHGFQAMWVTKTGSGLAG